MVGQELFNLLSTLIAYSGKKNIVSIFPCIIRARDWDILIKVKEKDVAAIGRFVVDKLRTVRGIEKTLTCMVFDTAKETLDIAL